MLSTAIADLNELFNSFSISITDSSSVVGLSVVEDIPRALNGVQREGKW